MLWQKAVFVLGLAPSLGLTAKIPLLPNSRRDLGIWLIDADNMSGGQVELYQNTSDGGPLIQSIQAAFTVPNLTFASGQDASGAPYQLSLGCGISGTTIGSTVPCNNLGPRAGIHANLSGDGTMSYEAWWRWTLEGDMPFSSQASQQLNLSTGDSIFLEIFLNNSADATFKFTNLKDDGNPVVFNWTTTQQDVCNGDNTKIFAGCELDITDVSNMPGFSAIEFESLIVTDLQNETHDFDIDQDVNIFRLIKDNKVYAQPMLEEPRAFQIEWSENPSYGSDSGSGGGPSKGKGSSGARRRWYEFF
ncbi:uncharacterized protein PG998_010757 [Apiospora kogelbergensis]